MKCRFYKEKGQCLKGNDPTDMGECVYKDGNITDKAAIHCSEGRKKVKD